MVIREAELLLRFHRLVCVCVCVCMWGAGGGGGGCQPVATDLAGVGQGRVLIKTNVIR